METKRVASDFGNRAAIEYQANVPDLENIFQEIETLFTECNQELAKAEMSACSYSGQSGEIGQVIGNMRAIQAFLATVHPRIYEELDEPLMTEFRKIAAFDGITLEELRTENSFRMAEYYTVETAPGMTEQQKIIKRELGLEDFLPIEGMELREETFDVNEMQTANLFQSLFQIDYEMSCAYVDSQGYDRYIAFYLDHDWEKEQRTGAIVSGLLDVIPVKPLVECIIGEDMITGRELSDMERVMQAASAAFGFTGIMKASVLLKGGSKEGTKIFAKTLAVNAAEDTAVYVTGTIGQELGLPDALVMALMFASGNAVSSKGMQSIENSVKMVDDVDYDAWYKWINGGTDGGTGTYTEVDELESFYDDIFEQQRTICQEYEDYLDELKNLQSDPYIMSEGGTSTFKYTEVKTFTAEETNQWFIDNVKPDYKPPYKPGTIVKEIELTENTTFVRVYDNMPDGSGMYGSWVMKAEDIEGLTPLEIQNKFALPNTPKYVCNVELEAGTHIRVGEVNPLDGWGSGGGTQYDLIGQRIGDFKNERLLEGN